MRNLPVTFGGRMGRMYTGSLMILRHPNVLSSILITRRLTEIKQPIFLIHSPGDFRGAHSVRNPFIYREYILIVLCIHLEIRFYFLDVYSRIWFICDKSKLNLICRAVKVRAFVRSSQRFRFIRMIFAYDFIRAFFHRFPHIVCWMNYLSDIRRLNVLSRQRVVLGGERLIPSDFCSRTGGYILKSRPRNLLFSAVTAECNRMIFGKRKFRESV